MPNFPVGPSQERIASGREYVLDRQHVIKKTVVVSRTATDSGGGPSTTLRKGLALGKETSTGKYYAYNVGNSPTGTSTFRGFLDVELDLLDAAGVAQDAQAPMVVWASILTSAINGIAATAQDGTNGCFFLWN